MNGLVRYDIEHVSRYSYSSPVRNCVMALCLEPRNDLGQRLLRFDVTTEPLVPLNDEVDYFGNTKHVLNVHREHESLEVIARSTVETTPSPPWLGSLGEDAWEEIRSWSESFRDWDFTHPSEFTRRSPALDSFVDRHGIATPGGDPLQALTELSDTLHGSFEYAPGSTSVVSPIDHILESGQGVCQDYAHVMIAIARSWGVPTRYVSGYFYAAGREGEPARGTATHAWVECRLPELGWVGFDPTNDGLGDERHVRMAVGRDYGDVAPTRGVFKGVAETRLDVDIVMTPRPAA